jgi:hypothetical protein
MGKHELGLIPLPTVVRGELSRNYEQARLLRRLLKLSEDAAVKDHQRDSEQRHRQPHTPEPEATRPKGVTQ